MAYFRPTNWTTDSLTESLLCKLSHLLTIQNGSTALMWAIRYGHSDIATLLIDIGALVDISDKVRI